MALIQILFIFYLKIAYNEKKAHVLIDHDKVNIKACMYNTIILNLAECCQIVIWHHEDEV